MSHRSEFDGPPIFSPDFQNGKSGYTEPVPDDKPTFEESVLQEAERITKERGVGYGHPLDNHTCTASLLSSYIGRKYGVTLPIDAEDVCWFNILQKISREANSQKHDNLADVAGFVKNIDDIRKEQDRRGNL